MDNAGSLDENLDRQVDDASYVPDYPSYNPSLHDRNLMDQDEVYKLQVKIKQNKLIIHSWRVNLKIVFFNIETSEVKDVNMFIIFCRQIKWAETRYLFSLLFFSAYITEFETISVWKYFCYILTFFYNLQQESLKRKSKLSNKLHPTIFRMPNA